MKVEKYLQYSLTITLFAISFILFIRTSNANIIDNPQSTDLFIEYQTKTKPNAEPKLSSENFLSISGLAKTDLAVKYAGVSFIFGSKKNVSVDSNNTNLDTKPIEETKCPAGQENVNGVCMDVTACKEAFPLASADKDIGTYVTKNCGSKGTGYCYTSCQTGYRKNGCECMAVDCSGYPLSTSGNNCDGIKSCKTGDNYKYKCTGCADGYKLTDSGACIEKKCSDYGAGYLTASTAHCVKNDIKRIAESHCYKCTECEEGYELSVDFTCTAKQCSAGYATGMTNVAYPCTDFTSQIAGKDICHSCTACSGGDSVSGGKCGTSGCVWGNHTLSSCPTNCNCSSETCGGSTKYAITSAQTNYYVSGNTCPACTWNGYTLTSCPTGCNCDANTCGDSTKYDVTSAKSNYYVSGNTCLECTWGGRSLSSCPSNCNCDSNTCGGSTKYGVISAKSNYYVSGNTCQACTWNGYTLTSCPTGCNCDANTCGGSTKYATLSAQPGYRLINGNTCEDICHWPDNAVDTCPTGCYCSPIGCAGLTKYMLSGAQQGYMPAGTTCIMNPCNGYGSPDKNIPFCSYVDPNPCYKGPTPYYRCDSCMGGSHRTSDGLCESQYKMFYDGSGAPIAVAISSNLAVDISLSTARYQPYEQAVSTCSNLTKGGKTWRLMTREELMMTLSIINNDDGFREALRYYGGGSSSSQGSYYWISDSSSGSQPMACRYQSGCQYYGTADTICAFSY